jgi:hypothetical protein
MSNRPEDSIGGPLVVVLTLVFIISFFIWLFSPEPPPPKPIEQIREERKESYNEAGKAVHEFLRGVAGFEKTKKEPENKPIEKVEDATKK